MITAIKKKRVSRQEGILEPAVPGQPTRCRVALSDVTRMESERSRLAAIVESSEDAIVSGDLDGRIITWNASAAKMFGWSAAEIVGRSFAVLVPSDHPEELPRIRQTIERGEVLAHFESVRMARDGRLIPVSITCSPIKGAGGKVVGISVILRNVTRQKEAETALLRSEAALADFFAEAPMGLLWVGADGRILRVNRAQLEMLGYAGEEVFGHPVAAFHANPEAAAEALVQLAKQEALSNYRTTLRRKDGSIRHVLIDANGLWEGGRLRHSRWFVRDISRQVELEREILRVSELEQRRMGEELHDDVCQQLTGIEFLAQGLELSAMSKAAARSAARISRLLRQANEDVRQLSHGLAPVRLETGGLGGALEALARRSRRVFRSDCRVRCDKSITIGDPQIRLHLYRIAQEAVGNATKHGRAKRIDIRLAIHGDRLVLGIHDNGVGLPKSSRGGKGMGLRLMQYRAGLISGSLVVQRNPSGGTSVLCSIHRANARPQGGKRK